MTWVSLPRPVGSSGEAAASSSAVSAPIWVSSTRSTGRKQSSRASSQPGRSAPRAFQPCGRHQRGSAGCPWVRSRARPCAWSLVRARTSEEAEGNRVAGGWASSLALPVEVPQLLFLLVRDADDREFLAVAGHIAREPLAEHPGVQRIGLHPFALLVELLRRDHVAGRARGRELPAQPEAEAARFIDDEDLMAACQQRPDPRHELRGPQPPRRLGRGVILLRHDDVTLLVNVQPELDRRDRSLILLSGDCLRGHPCGMNNVFLHSAGELPRSPASFHAIYHL